MTPPLILASASPRRAEILRLLGYPFEVRVRPIDESLASHLPCAQQAEAIARAKAEVFSDLCDSFLILTADTAVCLNGEHLAKSAHAAEAAEMLRKLSGKVHEVITGVCMFHKQTMHAFSETTRVYFRELSEADITFYIKQYQPFDKAGAYGIQEWIGLIGIEKIEGDYYNVMGFPAGRFRQELIRTGWAI